MLWLLCRGSTDFERRAEQPRSTCDRLAAWLKIEARANRRTAAFAIDVDPGRDSMSFEVGRVASRRQYGTGDGILQLQIRAACCPCDPDLCAAARCWRHEVSPVLRQALGRARP